MKTHKERGQKSEDRKKKTEERSRRKEKGGRRICPLVVQMNKRCGCVCLSQPYLSPDTEIRCLQSLVNFMPVTISVESGWQRERERESMKCIYSITTRLNP